jgi:hypothetical protein
MKQHTGLPITESVYVHLYQALDALLEEASRPGETVAGFERARLLLEALPLGSAEFGLAVNRLANARHYLQSGEYGAAHYELRLLRRSLQH